MAGCDHIVSLGDSMIARRSVLLLPLLVAACDDGDEAPRVFSAPSYSYLTPIRLNVAAVEIDNSAPTSGGRFADPAHAAAAGRRIEADGQ